MAYMSFTTWDADTTATAPRPVADPVPVAASTARLSALEWSVVALAAKDPLSSLRTPGRMAIAMGALFGDRRRSALADPRLEALRRIAVLGRHQGYTVAPTEIRAFVAAGFSEDQYELVIDSLHAAARRAGARA
ncbi:hypothetical protein FHT00_000758 [Sphingomonas insulae]|uniref:Uncharacterized protein n=1 Tax=Sphingomonas insulae TaxID=424800 RepID=A0ABP3T846_9SPHN|nr:hypothetical protein [Sphingomonas insulae]NIJ28830.1 hypothetical protein [Sphingomonas insulae]